MSQPSPPPTTLYKILPTAPPTPLPATLPLSPLDANDGFIHLSTATQVPGTAARFFADAEELYLFKLAYTASGAEGKVKNVDGADSEGVVKWEEVKLGEGEGESVWFPHLFGGALGKGNCVGVERVERGKGWEGLKLEW